MKRQKEKEQQEPGGEETDRGSATSGSGDDQSDTSASEDNQDEDLWRQNRGGAHSDKHHAAYGPGLQAKHDEDVEYKRLRKKYTPQEIVLLRALEHEKNYMHSLEQNDGKMVSPVQITDPEHRLLGVDKQDTMTPDNWLVSSSCDCEPSTVTSGLPRRIGYLGARTSFARLVSIR